jgi:glucose-6-phosphate isomerase
MRGQYFDGEAFERALGKEDRVLYEVYEIRRPEKAGELLMGVSIVHPGLIGDEYFMTKGHFHTILETAEVYYCLKGSGIMVLESPEGDWAVERLSPGTVLYVTPCWAHRSVNIGKNEDLIMLYVYPGQAGHDYRTIEVQGFRKRIVERDGQLEIVGNPRWKRSGEDA